MIVDVILPDLLYSNVSMIDLTTAEHSHLERILQNSLEREKRINIPLFFGIAAISSLLPFIFAIWMPQYLMVALWIPPFTGLMAFGRLNVAKLFRIIHYQNQLINQRIHERNENVQSG